MAAIDAPIPTVAVFTARGVIRKRKLRRWLRFWEPDDLPEQAPVAEPVTRETVRRSYAILHRLPGDGLQVCNGNGGCVVAVH